MSEVSVQQSVSFLQWLVIRFSGTVSHGDGREWHSEYDLARRTKNAAKLATHRQRTETPHQQTPPLPAPSFSRGQCIRRRPVD